MSDKAREALDSLVKRAESTWADEGLTSSDPLSVEVNGKYVDVLLSTGGPHTEVQFEFYNTEDGEYWFENEPRCGRLTYMDWGTREDTYFGSETAWLIQSALMRDADDLVPRLDKVGMTVLMREGGVAQVEVDFGFDSFVNNVDDMEPYEAGNDLNTVWGPILQRALDEAIADLNRQRHGLHTVPDFTVAGWKEVMQDEDDMFVAVFEVAVEEYVPESDQ